MKYEIKLLAVMLMVIATAAVLTTAATSDETDDRQPDWVYGDAWFGWYPSHTLIGQTVRWNGGVDGFGILFFSVVQINRPFSIEITSWEYTIRIEPGIRCEPCEVVHGGLVYMDGQLWRTWHTWNPKRNGLHCICAPTFFTIEIKGWAIPHACGEFIGRSYGGVSGFIVPVSSTLRVC
jgi:hypothetical protein